MDRGEARHYLGLGLAALKAKSFPWECLFCGEVRKASKGGAPGRKPLTCGDEICRKSYQRYWRRDRDRAAARRGGP